MPYLHLDGCDLYYETHGAGPALFFAHGGSGNQLSWWQQVPHFKDRYTCVLFSQRGTGLSREAPDSVGPAAFVDDLAALIDHLGVADVRLVANSMGGWIFLDYALREPARVKALVLASSTGSVTHPEIDRVLDAHRATNPRARLAALGVLPACGERMAREQPALHYLYGRIGTQNVPSPLGDINVRLQPYRTTTAEALAGLDLPVVCIAGDEDVLQPPRSVEILATLIPGARFVRVPEAGHSVYWERAETFNRLVDELLVVADGPPRGSSRNPKPETRNPGATMADVARVRESLRLVRRESDRFVADLAALSPGAWDSPSICAPWTVRLLAAHVARQVDSYIGSVEQGLSGTVGEPESREARARIMNEIAALEIPAILDLMRSTNDRFEAWFGALTPEQLDVRGPHSHGPRTAAWFVDQRLAEVAFHRLDLERSVGPAGAGGPDAGGPSPDLDRETARFLLPMLLEQNVPAIVARDKTGGTGTFAVRVRGEPAACWRLQFRPGALDVTPGAADAEVELDADPPGLALMMYGRATWQDLEQAGRLTVSGDRAAAESFHTLFKGP